MATPEEIRDIFDHYEVVKFNVNKALDEANLHLENMTAASGTIPIDLLQGAQATADACALARASNDAFDVFLQKLK